MIVLPPQPRVGSTDLAYAHGVTLLAITHLPSPRMNEAVRTFIDVRRIDLERAAWQHAEYRRALEHAGTTVVVLDGNLDHPDAVFVEDTAIVLDEIAIVASMGAPSRRDETGCIEAELRHHRAEIARIEHPATLEGGDVLRVGRTLFVGATGRTNRAGLETFTTIARRHGYDVRSVAVDGCLHLKTACTALPDGTMLINARWIDTRALAGAHLLDVASDEPDAANVVLVGERVLMSSAYPRTIEKVRAHGVHVDTVDLSEFSKAEGSATCLSILVP